MAGLASAQENGKLEVNVGFANERGRAAAERAATEVSRTFTFDALTATMPEAAVEGLRTNPNVRYVEENGTMEALAQTLPYGIDRVDAEVAISDGETGSGADVAILDTGIDSDHPDLQSVLGTGKAFVDCGTGGLFGCAFSGNSNACNTTWDDDNDHGSHVAGTAAAQNDTEQVVGVAPGVTLHAVKVLDCGGSGSFSDIAAGVEYVANQGWDVINMSLGGSSGSSTLRDAVQFAAGEGVTMVAAAGNSGSCTDCVGFPAAYNEVIAVSATDSNDQLASFSSTGPEVELAAPGVDVLSTVPGGTTQFSGTSMSSPHVAGAAAQLAANGQSRTEIESTLKNAADDLGLPSNEQGAGLVDVAGALGLSSSDDL